VRVMIVVAALAASLAVPVLAQADESPAKQAPPLTVAQTVAKVTAHKFPVEAPVGIAATCNAWGVVVNFENVYGADLYHYYQTIYWCWNGSVITTNSRSRYGEAYVYPWSFQGHIESRHRGGDGQQTSEWFTRGHFCSNFPVFGCVQHSYPWINMGVDMKGNIAWQYGID
jgi:hypothetical protein